MHDVDGPEIAVTVYKWLFSENAKDEVMDAELIPYALHAAVQKLRASNISANRWATYVHLGA